MKYLPAACILALAYAITFATSCASSEIYVTGCEHVKSDVWKCKK